MTSYYYDNQDFYKRMLDLQEKLRKSEKERIRLEERFKLLVQESQNRHDACINRLRLRYIEFLEEQRDRVDRNNKLQGTLHKVDSHLELMTAKSDRLNVLKKHYETYLLQFHGNQPGFSGSVTGDSGVISQNENRSLQGDFISQRQRHFIQNVSISPTTTTTTTSTPNMNFPSRVVTPTLSQYSELRFFDSPKTHQGNFSYSHQQPVYSTPKSSYKQPAIISPSNFRLPEIRISPSFSTTLVSRDVQTDKTINSFFNQSYTSMEPCQISGIGRISQVSSTQAMPQFSNQHPNQITSSFQIHDINKYLYNPSLPKTNNFIGTSPPRTRTESLGFSGLENRPNDFRSTIQTPHYTDHSWKYAKSSTFDDDDDDDDRSFRVLKRNVYEKNSIFEGNPTFDKNSIFEKNSRFENKSPPRYFRRFDFNTTFKKNDRPLASSKDFLNSLRTKASQKHLKLSTNLKNDYDAYDKSRRIDNELNMYIGKIRNLHKDLDFQSLEDLDPEQNTSGDLLNVTLSDDDLDLPVERKNKENCCQEERRVVGKDDSQVSGKHRETSKIPNAVDPMTQQTDAAVSETRYDVVPSNEEKETSAVNTTDEISSKIAKRGAKITGNENINSGFAESVENNVDKPLDERQRNRVVFDDSNKVSVFGELIIESDDLLETNEKYEVESEKEIQLNGLIEIKEKSGLESSDDQINEASNQKTSVTNSEIDAKVKEIDADGEENYFQSLKTNEIKEESEVCAGEKEEEKENQQVEVEEKLKENQDFVPDENQDYQYNSNQDYNYDPNAEYDHYQTYPTEGYEQYNQEYDPNQQYIQDPSQYAQDANQYNRDSSQYIDDPNQYAQNSNQEYDAHQQYEQDPNQQYNFNEYTQDSNQYNQDPNQFSQNTNQYSQDVNQQIQQDPSQQYTQDQSQEYIQDPNEYDPNQQYHDQNAQYDPNQAYDYTEPQEYSQQEQSYVQQQEQAGNLNETYDENHTPEIPLIENESEKVQVEAQEEKASVVGTNIKNKDVINLESDTESTIERNASNTESDFDFN